MAYVEVKTCKAPDCTSSKGTPICCNTALPEFGYCLYCAQAGKHKE